MDGTYQRLQTSQLTRSVNMAGQMVYAQSKGIVACEQSKPCRFPIMYARTVFDRKRPGCGGRSKTEDGGGGEGRKHFEVNERSLRMFGFGFGAD